MTRREGVGTKQPQVSLAAVMNDEVRAAGEAGSAPRWVRRSSRQSQSKAVVRCLSPMGGSWTYRREILRRLADPSPWAGEDGERIATLRHLFNLHEGLNPRGSTR